MTDGLGSSLGFYQVASSAGLCVSGQQCRCVFVSQLQEKTKAHFCYFYTYMIQGEMGKQGRVLKQAGFTPFRI